MKLLFINACPREESRTLLLAKKILGETTDFEICELDLYKEDLRPLDKESLERRNKLIAFGEWDHPVLKYAKQFAEADRILIAAPFWDLSFPAMLKVYVENITVSGITFNYFNGKPRGYCRADKLIYVTTAGGKIVLDYGYSYIHSLATVFFGIKETVCYRQEELDVYNVGLDELFDKAEIKEITQSV